MADRIGDCVIVDRDDSFHLVATRAFRKGELIFHETTPACIEPAKLSRQVEHLSLTPTMRNGFELLEMFGLMASDPKLALYSLMLYPRTKAQQDAAKFGDDDDTMQALVSTYQQWVSKVYPERRLDAMADTISMMQRLSKVTINKYCIGEPDQPDAYALFAFASFVDHSCHPNAMAVRSLQRSSDGAPVAKVRLIACRDIAAGETITHSYIGYVVNGMRHRLAKIQSQCHFVCKCSQCMHEYNFIKKAYESGRMDSRLKLAATLMEDDFHVLPGIEVCLWCGTPTARTKRVFDSQSPQPLLAGERLWICSDACYTEQAKICSLPCVAPVHTPVDIFSPQGVQACQKARAFFGV